MKFPEIAKDTLKCTIEDLRMDMVKHDHVRLAELYKRILLVEYMMYDKPINEFQYTLLRRMEELDRFGPDEQYFIYKLFERAKDMLQELESP